MVKHRPQELVTKRKCRLHKQLRGLSFLNALSEQLSRFQIAQVKLCKLRETSELFSSKY